MNSEKRSRVVLGEPPEVPQDGVALPGHSSAHRPWPGMRELLERRQQRPDQRTAAAPTIHPKVDGDINFLTFAEYIPPDVVTAFEKKYGVKVNQSFYSTQPEMVTKMATGQPIDLVLGDSAPHPQLLAGKLSSRST